MELVTRLLIAVVICAGGCAVYFIGSRVMLTVLRRQVSKRRAQKGLEGLIDGVPAILYFTTPDCAPCKTVQMPAIQSLLEQFGDQLQLIKIDATERTDVADFWGVLSVPTTFIIDAQGKPRRVNHGVAPIGKLRQQLREIGVIADRTASNPVKNMPALQSLTKTQACEEC
jgi:thioredoxin 1